AAPDEPAPGLRERDPHEPAAALARAPGERHHRAERHQIAGQVIDRRHRVELRARLLAGEELALTVCDAADRLHDRVEATAGGPGADVAERAQRDEDDPGPELGELLGRESAGPESPGPVALREHVGLADEPPQRVDVPRLAQVEVRGELAV